MPRAVSALMGLVACGLAGCASLPATAPAPEPPAPPDGPALILRDQGLPHGLPPFDRIRTADFREAFALAMAEHRAEVEAIVSQSAAPSFENTVLAYERAGQALFRTQRLFFTWLSAHADDELRAIQTEIAPRLAEHFDAIQLDPRLFARIDALYAKRLRLGLDSESLRLVEHQHRTLVRAGARLSPEAQARLRALNGELAVLTAQFQQRLQADANDLALRIRDPDELRGLPPDAIAAARAAAQARGIHRGYLIGLQLPTPQPLLAQLERRDVRERLYRAAVSRGSRGNEHDTRAIIRRMAALRAERAGLLGYPHFAAFALEDQMAGSVEAVQALLEPISRAARANAEAEARILTARMRREGHRHALEPWDWAYWAEAVRKGLYEVDETVFRLYFELDRVLEDGAFYMAERLYGLRFQRRPDLPAYHPDVRVYEVFDHDGASLGLLLFDPYQRPSKRGGAWMTALTVQSGLLGSTAVVTNVLNIPKPAEGQPTLLTYTEANTLFHELGHALHGLLSNVRYPSFSGTQVPRDFVEYPSQVHEIWLTHPEVLARFARDVDTGAPMPAELIERLVAAEQFNQGFRTLEYVAAAWIDLAWHTLPPGTEVDDVEAFEAAALARAGVDFAPVPPRYRSPYFNHAFGGMYAAGYYSYLWSEVLSADTGVWFELNGGLNRRAGERFRRLILSRGSAEEAVSLYRQFRGREASVAPLLRRRGLDH